MSVSSSIHPSQPRQTVQVRFPSGATYDGPVGSTAESFVLAAGRDGDIPTVACLLDGRLRELATTIERDCDLAPVRSTDSDGVRIYRRSLCFLMVAAVAELFPDDAINIQHSVPSGGYYCERVGRPPYNESQLARLTEKMEALVAADMPLTKHVIPLAEAVELFERNGDTEKAQLLTRRRKDYLTVYELNGVRDYFHGFMVPRSGYLTRFALRGYADGFILCFPRRSAPQVVQPLADELRLDQIFRTYGRWLDLIDVPGVNALNRASEAGRGQEVVLIAEALHRRQVANIADEIARRRKAIRLVLISGPTSAGKSTFSKRLAVQLMARGIHPLGLGMDDYFVNRTETPRDTEGNYDFESLEAVDLPLLHAHLRQLMAGETVVQPVFNFRTGVREWGRPLTMRRDQVLLIEGIHGLNPRLIGTIPADITFRIFISPFTQLNLDRHNRIPTTDTRKLRRIVRDYQYRGHNAAATIQMWPRVRRGEREYIFPFQARADAFFNSALVYELAALKPLAEPILLQVEPGTPERIEANRLLAFLQWFDPLSPDALATIPNDSLLREFIGGSILERFEPWIR